MPAYTYGKPFFRIAANRGHIEGRFAENAFQHAGYDWLKLCEGLIVVRRLEPVIGYDQQVIPGKTKFAGQTGLLFQKAAALNRCLQYRRKTLLRAASNGLLAIVEEAQPALRHVHAEITFVCHEKDAGPLIDMAVVVNVDEKVILDDLLLNPPVKNRYEVAQRNGRGGIRENLYAKSVQFHEHKF
jgi:hypothetical protein